MCFRTCLCAGIIDFYQPTLIIVGNRETYSYLAEIIRSRTDFSIEIKNHRMDSRLMLIPTFQKGFIYRYNNDFKWNVSLEESIRFSEILDVISESLEPCHNYLDPRHNFTEYEIRVTKGEYDCEEIFGIKSENIS